MSIRTARDVAALARPGSPLAVPVLAALALTFLALPFAALIVRAPWASLGSVLATQAARQALVLSLWTASLATAVALLLGVPLAILLARARWRGAGLVRALVVLPVVLPPVAGGVALLLAFGRTGVVGTSLDSFFGVSIPFTPVAVVMAQVFVAMPFLIIAVEGALRGGRQDLEEAARVLGASERRVLWRVTLRSIIPAVAAGAVLCWARALGEFGATVTFAGSLPGSTQTLPIELYYAMQRNPESAVALSLLLVAVCLVVLVALRRSWTGGVVLRG